ncbi:MAG TPA: type II secretion system protein [Solirubrobacteraceae bacterium]|nr:type II secretion system protein [Solirubrobacteraceae bacterium]
MSKASPQAVGGSTAGESHDGELVGSPRAEHGFSLIELLVVCLVIAVLCAIAIPQFLSQSDKARDASAKELVHHAEVAAEAIATDHDGSYENVTREEIRKVEPNIPVEKTEGNAYISAARSARGEYAITATATDGDELTLSRSPSGAITRTCRSPISKKGCAEGETGNW